jgi:hypothetical protein
MTTIPPPHINSEPLSVTAAKWLSPHATCENFQSNECSCHASKLDLAFSLRDDWEYNSPH